MGGFFHLVDLKQGTMARKIGTQKRNVRGLEAPRNSLDLPVGTHHSYYNQQQTNDWYETGYCPTEAPMKKLISDEMTKKPPTRTNAPSIVARLMGVDTMPVDTKPANDFYKEKLTRSSSASSTLSSKSFRQTSLNSLHLNEDSDSDEWSVNTSSKKPTPREHPQEEELQKFKKEFEAWQTARFKECSKIVENVAVSDQWIAQENLNKQKLALYANSGTKVEKHEDLRKSRSLKSDDTRSHPVRRETLSEDFDQYSAPTKIVILRPGFDNVSNSEEPWASSSGASEDRNKIEDFLEEVKERLKFELQGKSFKRGGGIETPYSERLSDPKQIAQRIAKQVRESVTKDLGTNLLRSESTRSYKNEFQCSGTNSPEFISRDTRKLLSERLRNVLKRESSTNSNDETDIQSKSFRCGPDDMILSPVNLVRSLSAPVSGTSFGKLLLEDRHVVTGAHIRRKHESSEKIMKVKKQRKDKFNLKEKVSSFKYSLSLRARLFGRKIHSANEFREDRGNDRNFVKDIMNGPTVMLNFPDRPENSTEVPPSPASVCSSIHEEFFRYCASPTTTITTPGAPTLDDNDLPQAFRDISSNLNELRKKLHELGTGRISEETVIEEQPYEPDTIDLEDENEAYIQDLLIASGLYHNSFDKSLSKWDTFAKPITNQVFEQVESSQKHTVNTNKLSPKESNQQKVDHKLLFDLLNEVLSTVLARRKGTGMRPPHGDTLLDQVWGMLREYLNPHVDKSFYFFDTMVARDLRSMPWLEFVSEEIDVVAKEIECHIIRDLVEETVRDMVRV